MSELLLLFTHIPKCAGTSFRKSLVENNIPPELIYWPKKGISSLFCYQNDFRFLVGHYPAGVEWLLSPFNPAKRRPVFRVVFLRSPMEQLTSYYSYHRRLAETAEEKRDISEQSITEFFKNNPGTCNLQTRACAGLASSLFSRLKPDIGRIQLKIAQRNLRTYFDFVGNFSRLEEEMVRLANKTDLKYCPSHVNSANGGFRIEASDLTINEELLLRSLNKFDFELYDFARSNIWCEE